MINRSGLIKKLIVSFLICLAVMQVQAQQDHYLDSLLRVLSKNKLDDKEKASVYQRISKAYLHRDDKKAFAYADSAIALGEKSGNSKAKAESLSMQGVIFKDEGEFEKAVAKHLLALKIKEQNQDTAGVAICYNDIGVLYKVMGNFPRALEYYKKSNALCRQINLGKGIAQTYNNMGTAISVILGKDSGLVYYKLALDIAEKIHSNSAISTACNNMGQYYGEKGENEKALLYFNRCLQIDEQDGNVYGMILSHMNIGLANSMLKKYKDAQEHFDVAEKLCLENSEKPMLKDLYWAIATNHARSGEKDKAYDFMVKYKNLSEELQTEEINQNILEAETKYQTQKKDLELAKNQAELLARKEQAQLKNIIIIAIIGGALLLLFSGIVFYRKEKIRQKAEKDAELSAQKEMRSKAIIEAEEKERVRIAKDLHDGIGQLLSAAKMNLSSIESKLDIKSLEQQTAFKNAVDLLDESVKEVRSVSHNMMPNTLIKLGLASAVREFITKIQSMPDLKVNLEIVGMNERLEQEKESILYRVIQEVVSNIIKHAKASELVLQLIRHEKELTVIIEDNGIGFDASKLNDFEGIGLKNIISRVEFLNGTVHFDSTPGRGTNVIVDIPL